MLEVVNIEHKAQVIMENYRAYSSSNISLNQYILMESESDPQFFHWLFGVSTEKEESDLYGMSQEDLDYEVKRLMAECFCVESRESN